MYAYASTSIVSKFWCNILKVMVALILSMVAYWLCMFTGLGFNIDPSNVQSINPDTLSMIVLYWVSDDTNKQK